MGNRRPGLPSLLLLGLAVWLGLGAALASATELGSAAVLVVDRHGRLHRLDPLTLTELPTTLGPSGARSADHEWGSGTIWVASADGSTLVQLRAAFGSSGTGIPAIVYDVATGRSRHRFAIDHPRQVVDGRLSTDGRRLVVRGFNFDELDVIPPADDSRSTWRVYDTTNGRLLATAEGPAPFPVPEFDAGAMQSWVIDPAATRLYQIVTTGDPWDRSAFSPIEIVAQDLTSGSLLGRLPLPDVTAGTVATDFDRTNPPFETWEHRVPSLAISPDGRRLAVIHPDGGAATLIDAARLVVERVVPLAEPDPPRPADTGNPPTNSGALGLLVSSKIWRVAFAADGGHLYRAGHGSVIVDQRAQLDWTTDLELIDLATGTVVARAPGAGFLVIAVAPDGENVYLYRQKMIETETGGMRVEELGIARLDATTLRVLATAPTGLYPPIMVIPA